MLGVYQPGDRVVVQYNCRPGDYSPNDGIYLNEDMEHINGQVVTIKEQSDDYDLKFYYVEEYEWCFDEEWLIPADDYRYSAGKHLRFRMKTILKSILRS